MYVIDFSNLRDVAGLCSALSCSGGEFDAFRNHSGAYYVRHELQKKSGHGKRVVWEISNPNFKTMLQSLAKRLFDYGDARVDGFPHDACHGYMPGRSIRTNAAVHVGSTQLLKSDIHEFFASITHARVLRLFLNLEFQRPIAEAMADLTTHNGTLPLGSPASPVIANLVTLDLDIDLAKLANRCDCHYTRYSDDLAFSSNSNLPTLIELRSILERHNFGVVSRKTRFLKRGHSHYVTGLSISTSTHPRAPRHLKRRLRQEMHFIEKYGLESHLGRSNYPTFQSGINQIDGTIRWLRGIEPWFANPIYARWEKALKKSDMVVSYTPRLNRPPRDVCLLIDEADVVLQGVTYLVVGAIVLEDVEHARQKLETLRESWLGDAFYAGNKGALEKKGIHWVDLPEGAREELVRELAEIPFRAYAALKPVDDSSYQDDYLFLLIELLKGRFTGLDGCNLEINFEENSKVRYDPVKILVEQLYHERVSHESRRPRAMPRIQQVSKQTERAIPIVDAMLGVLCRYLAIDTPKPSPTKHGVKLLAFERLRLKFRLILPFDKVYGRRKAFNRWRSVEPAVAWLPPTS